MLEQRGISIRRLGAVGDREVEELADLLVDCVEGGASVSFMHPLDPARARSFWREVAVGVAAGERALLVAEDEAGIVGTVQLVFARPENQPHRADLSKLLVHRRARRRGLGEALMVGAEQLARDCGKTLLVLDTVTGSDAERLYDRLGWARVGVIPDYALLSRGGLWATTVFYKALDSDEKRTGRLSNLTQRRADRTAGEARGGPVPGQMVHIEIPADDTGKARAFWGGLFGWQFENYPGPSEYHMARINDQSGVAISNMEPGKRGTRTYFDVEDIEAGAAQVRELGGECDEPMPVPSMGWFATCRDPHGNDFGLWQTDPSAPTPEA